MNEKVFCIIFSTFLLAVPAYGMRGDLLNFKSLGESSRSQISQIRKNFPDQIPEPLVGVRFFKVTYESVDLKNRPTRLTGLLMVPTSSDQDFPLLSFQHGTQTARFEAPSQYSHYTEWLGAVLIYASQKYVVAAADYLGLGDSKQIHPYHHAQSEAQASADMLLASRHLLMQLKVPLSRQLFLSGYSQGGHATMALHRYLERNLPDKFSVTASTPMAGAYDLETTLSRVLSTSAPSSSAELAYLVRGMNEAYHLYRNPAEYFSKAVAGSIEILFDGKHTLPEIMKALPRNPRDLIKAGVFKLLQTDRRHPFVMALRKNNLYSWCPKAPVRLIHGEADIEVPFDNAVVAYQFMSACGAEVHLVRAGEKLDHAGAYWPSFLESLKWFESQRSLPNRAGFESGDN